MSSGATAHVRSPSWKVTSCSDQCSRSAAIVSSGERPPTRIPFTATPGSTLPDALSDSSENNPTSAISATTIIVACPRKPRCKNPCQTAEKNASPRSTTTAGSKPSVRGRLISGRVTYAERLRERLDCRATCRCRARPRRCSASVSGDTFEFLGSGENASMREPHPIGPTGRQ